jgi:hypothetical protein
VSGPTKRLAFHRSLILMLGFASASHLAEYILQRMKFPHVLPRLASRVSAMTEQSGSASSPLQLAHPATVPENLIGWFEVPNSRLREVCPANSPEYEFSSACGSVISAWNGAIADTRRNRLIIWGGGHADYFGNELYAFNLQDLTMTRLNNPSPINATSGCVETLSDGKPNSRHTYDSLVYIAHADRMFSFGGGLNACGFFSGVTWTLEMETLKWTNMQPRGGNPHAGAGVVADYDPNTKKIYLNDLSKIWSYDFDANTYRVLNSDAPIDYHMTGVIDPKREVLFIMGAAGAKGGGLKAISLAPGSKYEMNDWTAPAFSSCGPLLRAGSPGLAYDPAEDRIVGWPNFGDAVYLFNPETRSCTTETFLGGPPDSSHQGSPHTTNGTNGRFRYFPAKGFFVLVNQAIANVYLLRLTAAPAPVAH